MGGSAIGADFARTIIEGKLSMPIFVDSAIKIIKRNDDEALELEKELRKMGYI